MTAIDPEPKRKKKRKNTDAQIADNALLVVFGA